MSHGSPSWSTVHWRPSASQTLEQQLQEMRATYQLNTEKLEYNYRVLSERDMENSATLSHQKRKLNKLKDALSGLMQVCRRGRNGVWSSRKSRRWRDMVHEGRDDSDDLSLAIRKPTNDGDPCEGESATPYEQRSKCFRQSGGQNNEWCWGSRK